MMTHHKDSQKCIQATTFAHAVESGSPLSRMQLMAGSTCLCMLMHLAVNNKQTTEEGGSQTFSTCH